MALLRPNAKLSIAGRSLGMAEGAIVSVRVWLGLQQAHDGVRLQCAPASKFKQAAPGDALSLQLGGLGSETDVLSGEVLAVRQGPDSLVIDGVSATIALSRLYKTASHVNPTVADVVRDLAGSAAVSRIDAPLPLGAWFAENRLNVWQQLQALARLSGADLGSAADGGLRFVSRQAGGAPQRLRHGAQLLHWELAQRASPAAPAAAPHGAGSEAGSARWHWLSHDPVGAAADPSQVAGAVATRDAARSGGQALADSARRSAHSGRLLIVGDATLRPGALVQLADLADLPGANPGPLRVLAVQHTLDRASGFLTRLTVEGAA